MAPAAVQYVLRPSIDNSQKKITQNQPTQPWVSWSQLHHDISFVVVLNSSLPLRSSKGHIHLPALNQFHCACLDREEMQNEMKEGKRGRFSPPSRECPLSSEPAPLGAGPSQPPSAHHAAPPCGPGPGRQPLEGYRQSSQTNHGSVRSGERTEQLR